MELKRRLLIARQRLGYATQTELAKKIGVDPAVVSYWENGKREPTFEQAGKLIEIGMTTEDLFEINCEIGCVKKAKEAPKMLAVNESALKYDTNQVDDPLANSAIAESILKRLAALEQKEAGSAKAG